MLPYLLLTFGLVALVIGCESLVRGASGLARSLGIHELIVGLTVVAFGASTPLLAVSVEAMGAGRTDLALGSVVGANIFNVLFVIGLAAMIAPLVVLRPVVRQAVPIMIGASLLLLGLAIDGSIGRIEGVILVAALAVCTAFMVVRGHRELQDTEHGRDEERRHRTTSGTVHRVFYDLCLVAFGVFLLVLGSQWLVESGVALAQRFGASDLVIGLTVIAAGTSLPQFTTSLTSAVRGDHDLAVGTVVGSNVFNVLGVLGASALLAPSALPVPPAMLAFDMLVMVAVAAACLPVLFTGNRISRWEGGVFLAYYVAYTSYLILAAGDHDALDTYGLVMIAFVVPLTVLTFAVSVWRTLWAISIPEADVDV